MMSGVAVLLFLLANSLAVSLARQECTSSGDCPQEKVCAANLCEDPCPGFCGENTSCQVKWHTPICRCSQGYNGDPIQGCTKSAINECSFNGDCPLDKSCENHKCEDPCLGFCGNNTVCQVKRHTPVCSCLQGFIGEPMLGCTESAVPGQCYRNSDCDQDRACDTGQCHNPCHNVCGNNTVCRVTKHVPVCSCIEGFTGDPMEGCTAQECSFGANAKKAFQISKTMENWYKASHMCRLQGKRLATLETRDQDSDLVAEMKKAGVTMLWLAGSDAAQEGEWRWVTTGRKIPDYGNWISNEPNNYGPAGETQQCMEYWEYKGAWGWGDGACTLKHLYACEC